MLPKLLASWLVVLAVMPFTAPFSSFKIADVFGTGPSKRFSSDVMASVRAPETDATDLPSNPTTNDVRPVAASHGDTRLMRAVLPDTLAVISLIGSRRGLLLAELDHKSAPTRSLMILRL